MKQIIHPKEKYKKKATDKQKIYLKYKKFLFLTMNVYVFWILFFGLWGIVPLMIIKGRTDEKSNIKTVPEVKAKKKGWFN